MLTGLHNPSVSALFLLGIHGLHELQEICGKSLERKEDKDITIILRTKNFLLELKRRYEGN